MRRKVPNARRGPYAALAACLLGATVAHGAPATIVRFNTVMGSFDVQMFDAQMPRTVTNFLNYVRADKFDGSVVHRASDTPDVTGGPLRDFVIQGGGYYLNDGPTAIQYNNVPTDPPIDDEPGGGVAGPSNVRGTIAMAKSGPDTATSQWFINQGNNSFLDSPTRPDGGFSAFAAVLGNGMEVVDAIGNLPLPKDFGFSISSPFNDLPLRDFSGNKIADIRATNTVTVTSVEILTLPLGDFNRDGVANEADLAILQSNLNVVTSGAMLDDGDVDNDGDVDDMDLTIWQTRGSFSITNFSVNPATLDYVVQFTSEAGKNYSLQYRSAFALNGGPRSATQWTTAPGQGSRPGNAFTTTFTGNLNGLVAPNGLLTDTKSVYFRIVALP